MTTMYTESLRAFLKPVLSYLDDDSVSEIMINGPTDVWVERKGKLSKVEAVFSEEGLLGAARNMAQFVGRPLTDERPRLDARLPDGSRIHVVLPPIARNGATIAIRKFFKDKLKPQDLVHLGSITPQMIRLIEAIIRVRLNVLVSGGTGSGKTTLLNILSGLIPDDERILTIEDSAELQLQQSHLVSFESRPADKFGKGEVSIGDLLSSALRLRPDRIIVGEVRGGEAFDLMQALNTGHGGSMATVHANTPTDSLRRIESLCLMSGVELPMVAVRAQVASALQSIVCTERLQDGSRKVVAISEVQPLNDKGDYRTQDLWLFIPVTKDAEGQVVGYHAPTGILPSFLAKARAYGFGELTDEFFDPRTYGLPPPPLIHGVGESVATRWAPSLKHREQGIPDPDSFRDEWKAFEGKLRAARAPVVRASAPRPVPVVATKNDDTQPPKRNPLLSRKNQPESAHDTADDDGFLSQASVEVDEAALAPAVSDPNSTAIRPNPLAGRRPVPSAPRPPLRPPLKR